MFEEGEGIVPYEAGSFPIVIDENGVDVISKEFSKLIDELKDEAFKILEGTNFTKEYVQSLNYSEQSHKIGHTTLENIQLFNVYSFAINEEIKKIILDNNHCQETDYLDAVA